MRFNLIRSDKLERTSENPTEATRHKANRNVLTYNKGKFNIFSMFSALGFNPPMTRNARAPFNPKKRCESSRNKIFYGLVIKFYWHLKHQFINVSIYCDTFHLLRDISESKCGGLNRKTFKLPPAKSEGELNFSINVKFFLVFPAVVAGLMFVREHPFRYSR